MALNAEEKYRQAEYEIMKKEKEASESDRTIQYMSNVIDRYVEKHDQINGAINLYKRDKRSEGITLDTIRMIMRGVKT